MSTTQHIWRRLYRMRLATGALLSLPLILVPLWYGWSAIAELDRYRRVSDDDAPWSVELFHIALHDEMVRDLRRTSLPSPPVNSGMPLFDLSLSRDDLDGMYQQLYEEERDYVSGYVRKDGVMHEVRLRFRGNKPWHWLHKQKSMKLRLDKGDLIDGTRTFNLLNDPTPFGLEDQIVLDLAREAGLLTPEYHAARVRLNNSDMGVYRYAAQPTEGLLRRGRRVPGNLYSGDAEDLPPLDGMGALFFSREGWQQVAVRSGDDVGEEEFGPLDELLQQVQHGSFTSFADYAHREIDLDRYAIFDALDVAFGGNEHDYLANHKLYYDPYRGLFEPIAWSFRGFQHEPRFNLIDHPLLIRLKMTPGYLVRRNRAVFELLTGPASVPQVRGRTDRLFESMEADLATDAYWDAYKLLPRVTRYHRFMVRPMSRAKWSLAARAEIHGYAQRVRFLLDALERPSIAVTAEGRRPGVTHVTATVGAHGAHRLRSVAATSPCDGSMAWVADLDRDGRFGSRDEIVAAGPGTATLTPTRFADMLPGTRLLQRQDARPKRGTVYAAPESRSYPFLLQTPCAPTQVTMIFDDLVTGRQTRLQLPVVPDSSSRDRGASLPAVTSTPRLTPGQASPHPWDYPAPPPVEAITLGPGLEHVAQSRVFAAHQHVTVMPGTQLHLEPGISLVFHGPLKATGTVDQPIRIVAADSVGPFGGLALHGPGTGGSRLQHIQIHGGSRIGRIEGNGSVVFPSLLNIYDTRDIQLTQVRVSGVRDAEDVIHAAYVQDLRLHEVEVIGPPIDGVDLEFTQGQVRGLRVVGAGDDCLDLMGVDLQVSDTVLLGCTNNALSAGEESEVSAHGLLLGRSGTGVLAKSTSRARINRSLVFDAGVCLEVRGQDKHYQGSSQLGASDLFAVNCGQALARKGDTRVELGRIERSLPGPDALQHLQRSVLGVSSWSELPAFVAQAIGTEVVDATP